MEQMEFMTALHAAAGGTGPVYLHSLPMEQMEFMTALLLVLVGLALYIYIAYLWNRWSL
jgi:hypothetical protein